jgi:hypothetical protein
MAKLVNFTPKARFFRAETQRRRGTLGQSFFEFKTEGQGYVAKDGTEKSWDSKNGFDFRFPLCSM